MKRRTISLLVALALALTTLLSFGLASAQDAAPSEEFVGPFPSWNQVQCTGEDDTGLL